MIPLINCFTSPNYHPPSVAAKISERCAMTGTKHCPTIIVMIISQELGWCAHKWRNRIPFFFFKEQSAAVIRGSCAPEMSVLDGKVLGTNMRARRDSTVTLFIILLLLYKSLLVSLQT